MDFKWIFDGIGTELLSLCVGSIVGGVVGYKIGAKGISKQKQKSGTNAEQNQELEIDLETVKSGARAKVSQVQKAKDDASQSQVGRIKINNE